MQSNTEKIRKENEQFNKEYRLAKIQYEKVSFVILKYKEYKEACKKLSLC